MEGFLVVERCIFWLTAALMTCFVSRSHSSAVYIVGERLHGWSTDVNLTEWSSRHHFYVGDALYFGFEKADIVVEVNMTSYERCTNNFVKNDTEGKWFLFNLTEAKTYYFLGGSGKCKSHAMKLAVKVQDMVPAPSPKSFSVVKNGIKASTKRDGIIILFILIVLVLGFYFSCRCYKRRKSKARTSRSFIIADNGRAPVD